MKQNYFKMALVAIMFAVTGAFFTSCEPNDPLSGSGKMAYGLKWDNIVKYVLQFYGPTVVEIESDHYYFYWSENHDTLYIEKPTNYTGDTTYIVVPVEIHDTISTEVIVHDTVINTVIETVYDTVYQIDTTVLYDTIYITQDMQYIVNVEYGEENGYTVERVGDTLIITITFANVTEDYHLDIQPVINKNLFDSDDPSNYSKGGKVLLSVNNNRKGGLSYDRESSSAVVRRIKAANGGRDTVWVTSVANASGTASSVYVARKQPAGTRNNFSIAKDSCVYAFDYDGINYKMNITAESATGTTSDGKNKDMLAALPESATWEIVNTVDNSNTVVHEGYYYHKVHQVVRGTFTSRVLPERGSSRMHTDVVTLDDEVNTEMPVIYVIGDPIPGDLTPSDPEGFVFPDGERANGAQLSVVVDQIHSTLEEAILIHTSKSLYYIVAGGYVGYSSCTQHSLYNSLYMKNGKWYPGYISSEVSDVVWYDRKGGTAQGGVPKDEIASMLPQGTAHISTSSTSSFVRELTMVHEGNTTKFYAGNSLVFTASSQTIH